MVRNTKMKKCSGLAILETAIVLPLLLLVSLGALKYGYLFLRVQEFTNAARNGARVAIRSGATDAEAEVVVDRLMLRAGIPRDWYALTITTQQIPHATLDLGQEVVVHIEILALENVDILRVPLFPNPARLGASVTMAKEG
jgi:hypothetical protein